ncbi:rhamnogalacturonate lyase [Rhizoctonia solani]|uniref:rhamnogalacturonan endolyase n=1 Tax=Rhizoctonia solani TaxID=456999 RepID=A0A8H8P1D2_9AGAM|nr:rhamnogalacturonate lyase [Rhizoctonia solani]QRW22552.1 rhamnogalacturonate lyase [Rhizoctonia solani]
MRFSSLLFITGLPAALAAFGVTEGSGYIDVDTGNQLVYRVSTSSGDITSIKYNSVEYQYSKKYTQISSGLESATVTYKTSGEYITITITTNTLTQYYVAVSGQSALYIGTHITAEPSVGELRFIARLDADKLTGSTASDARGGTAIEGSDVFTVSGQTRSKFYSSVRFIEDQVHGVTGSGVGVYMVIPGNGYETSSGGPFHRDIDNQNSPSDDGAQEVYFYMNSNHEQTESYRTGFFGPYALVFTSGIAPSSSLDISFFENLGLEGYVASSGRGKVSGTVSGVASSFTAVVGLSNSAAQYWGVASGGAFSISGVKTGTYTATLYKNELEVATGSVTVSAGKTATLTLTSTESLPTLIWQIGVPDGTPSGFLNANKFETMHPSDSRMNSWGPVTYTIGSSSESSFPMAQFVAVNNPTTIKWTATSTQTGARTLRIRTTSSYNGGRPTIQVNSWTSNTPAAPTKIDSRGVTRGTWRGLNQMYELWVLIK